MFFLVYLIKLLICMYDLRDEVIYLVYVLDFKHRPFGSTQTFLLLLFSRNLNGEDVVIKYYKTVCSVEYKGG